MYLNETLISKEFKYPVTENYIQIFDDPNFSVGYTSKGMKAWHIVLISIFSVLLVVGIILMCIYFKKRRERV